MASLPPYLRYTFYAAPFEVNLQNYVISPNLQSAERKKIKVSGIA